MEITFLENGLHSLQKGYDSLVRYEEVYYMAPDSIPEKERFYLLKDAVLSIQHGIEILFKYVLVQSNELLIFSNLDNHFKKAYEEKRKRGLSSIFQLADKYQLHTISFSETIDRIDKLTPLKLTNQFKNKLFQIEAFRNQIMHSEILSFEANLHTVFEGLIGELDILLYKQLGTEYKMISGYGELVAKYQKSSKSIADFKSKTQDDVIKLLLSVFDYADIGMGENEVMRITDINVATKVLDKLFTSKFLFGADLTNGYCTGHIRHLKRIDDYRFSLFAEDNDGEYIFKFKSLIIYLPALKENKSPLLFIECDDDVVEASLNEFIDETEGIKSIQGITFKGKNITTFIKQNVEEAFRKESMGEGQEDFFTVEKFLSKGIFCFINIQQIEYADASRLLWKFGKLDGKRFELILKKVYTK
ncbi:MAG TPA: hypothetical protein PKD16_18155 [Saprospiraceae bacterium]|jgi:hypothetical protein|nr:hypothetical protein [Saprospiraceae bacterium]HMT72098.1 hypothetical protein [Saprospiraceae bacterium]